MMGNHDIINDLNNLSIQESINLNQDQRKPKRFNSEKDSKIQGDRKNTYNEEASKKGKSRLQDWKSGCNSHSTFNNRSNKILNSLDVGDINF